MTDAESSDEMGIGHWRVVLKACTVASILAAAFVLLQVETLAHIPLAIATITAVTVTVYASGIFGLLAFEVGIEVRRHA